MQIVNPLNFVQEYKSLNMTENTFYVLMRAPKTTAYYIRPIEIGLLWAKIIYLKSHSKALGFDPLTDTK